MSSSRDLALGRPSARFASISHPASTRLSTPIMTITSITSTNVFLPSRPAGPATIEYDTETGKITAITERASSTADPQASTLDVGSSYLIPGLVEYVQSSSMTSCLIVSADQICPPMYPAPTSTATSPVSSPRSRPS